MYYIVLCVVQASSKQKELFFFILFEYFKRKINNFIDYYFKKIVGENKS